VGRPLPLPRPLAVGPNRPPRSAKFIHSKFKRASFGDQVRNVARQAGQDPKNRAVLQQLGQALVLTRREEFIRDVLNQVPNAENVIVEGVRHVEVLIDLKRLVQPRVLKLVHIKTDAEIRQQRMMDRDKVERRVVARYDADITEAQINRILPQYADLTIDGSLPLDILADQVIAFLEGWRNEPEAKRA
jgi:dephospho-CoA kinase